MMTIPWVPGQSWKTTAVAFAGQNIGEFAGVLIGSAIANAINNALDRRAVKKERDERVREMVREDRLARLTKFNEEKYPQLYGNAGKELGKELFEKETKPVISRAFLEAEGPMQGHAVFIHEDTQPPGKKDGEGCQFSVWTWTKELRDRNVQRDYGSFYITQDEFEENEFDFQQRVCTYYVDTNTLIDEDGIEFPYVPNQGFECVGDLADAEWGKGSRRSDTIYLRNELLEEEYMVVRDFVPPPELVLAFGERMGDDIHNLEGHKDPKGW